MKDQANDSDRFNSLLAEVDEALMEASASTGAERKQSLTHAQKLVAELLAIAPDDADSNFAAGLTMYESWPEQEEDESLTEKYLLKALSVNPNHQLAKLYLGHHYYDNGKYEQALPLFEGVEEEHFLSIGQKWRVLKLHELILCCKLYLNDQSLSGDHFISLANEQLTADPEDVPVPIELITALVKTESNSVWNKVNRPDVLQLLRKTCEKLGFKEVIQELAPL